MEELEKSNGHDGYESGNGEERARENDFPKIIQLSGMYRSWFLDYASYVILERAVPHLHDGLKPVHRRILHAMKRLDDGRYNKVANIIGYTMQYHPHGDASIGDALVQLGQKDLLIDTQGNWGNLLTGDGAAASRYIEARLSPFALAVVFNPKTTKWILSYDGRNKEPLTLPVKFPLLLAQGVEGIAVGLASKVLPHNFIELMDASVAWLQGKSFELFPDFPGGGLVDCSRYNDGLRGGVVRIRSRITKLDKKTLVINDISYGRTTGQVIDSILKANEKGKIRIKKIDDNTADKVEILVHLAPGISPDKTIDALYAFTDCEVSVSPNACVIENDRPRFLGVSEMLRISTDHTRDLLKQELEIKLAELSDDWHMSSLEKIFIENRIYLDIEECVTWESVLDTIDKGLEPFKKLLAREVTRDDIVRLTEIKIKRISRYDAFKADEHIKAIEKEMDEVRNHLDNLIAFAINYFRQIKKKYGQGRERRTEIRCFDTIEATRVAVANEKLYVNRAEGFAGTGLKKDEYVCECSDIDDIIVFRRDGTYMVTKIAEKLFVGKNIIHIAVFNKNDKRTIYNVIYRDGLNGAIMMKRSPVSSVTRDREYNFTRGKKDTKILYFSANNNGEAEIVKVYLKPKPRLKSLVFELDFGTLAIKGKGSMGNILTRHAIHKIVLKEKGSSTLGGARIWFDEDINRLNIDGRGKYLGEFNTDDRMLVATSCGRFRLSDFEISNHFEDNIMLIEKYRPQKVFSAVYYDGEKKYYYLKRFTFENVENLTSFIGDHEDSRLVRLTEVDYPRLEVKFGGRNKDRSSEIIEVAEFIGVKGYKAKGKRLTTYEVSIISELEPMVHPKQEESGSEAGELFELDEPDNSQMKLEL